MAYKTCPDCGSRVFEHGCVNCNERDYILMQDDYVPPIQMTGQPLPTPAPVAELPKEAEGKAKELHHKFYRVDMMNEDLLHMDWEQAKQCALITNQCEIDLINRLLATNLNNDFDLLRERGELQDVRTAINQL